MLSEQRGYSFDGLQRRRAARGYVALPPDLAAALLAGLAARRGGGGGSARQPCGGLSRVSQSARL